MSGRLEFLEALEAIVDERLAERPDESYVARLAAKGPRRIAQKLGEEGVELALAVAACDRTEAAEEAADLLFHLLVALRVSGLSLAEVAAVLEARHRSRTTG